MNPYAETFAIILAAFAIGAPLCCAILAALERLGILDGER